MTLRHLFDTPTHRSFCAYGEQIFLPKACFAEALAWIQLQSSDLDNNDPAATAIWNRDWAAEEPWFLPKIHRQDDDPATQACERAGRIQQAASLGDPDARYLRAVRSELSLDGVEDWGDYTLDEEEVRSEMLALAQLGHHAPMKFVAWGVLANAGRWAGAVDHEAAQRWMVGAARLGDYGALQLLGSQPWGKAAIAAQPRNVRAELSAWFEDLRPGHDQADHFITSW